MRRSSSASSGFTIVELAITAAVTTLVLTSLCGIYFSMASEWEREQGEAQALLATSLACTRLSDYISQATAVQLATRSVTNDTLGLNMPYDTSHGGVYSPTWSDGAVRYRDGNWLAFYLSDSTGSISNPGTILWAASVSWSGSSYTVVPDSSWSLYYGSNRGKVAPLTSLTFSVDSCGARPAVTITAVATYKIGRTTKQIRQIRTVCLRNAN